MNPVRFYRFYRSLHLRGIRKLPRLLANLNFVLTGCDIPPQAVIGKRANFAHMGHGVILHHKTSIGDDVYVGAGVVLGQNVRSHDDVVPLSRITIGDRVVLGAGCKIIASEQLSIGDGATVGAGSVVLRSVPAGTMVAGVPAREIRRSVPTEARKAAGTE